MARFRTHLIWFVLPLLGLLFPLFSQDPTAPPVADSPQAAVNEFGEEEEPLPPPQPASYYLNRYATLAVPAILKGTEHVMVEGWKDGKVVRGITLQGEIKYRRCKVFNVEPKASVGYSISGAGRNAPFDKTVHLTVGDSYIFKMKSRDQAAFPMIVHLRDPVRPYQFFPYIGFELMNNDHDLSTLRFTPMPDTPDNLEFGNRTHQRTLAGKFQIIRDQPHSSDGVIHLPVQIRRPIVEKYVTLLENGHIKTPLSLGAETFEFYGSIMKGYGDGDEWFGTLGQYKRPGYRLILVRTDPAPYLQQVKPSVAFPLPSVLEKRPIHILDPATQEPSPSFKYLIQFKSSSQGDKFVEAILRNEAQFNPQILRDLNNPNLLTTALKVGTAMKHIEVDDKRMKEVFRRDRMGFETMLNNFKNLNLTYAVNDDALGEAQSLIFNGDYIRGLHKLRPHSYPLIKLAPIPKFFGNTRISFFQDHIEYLLQSLLDGARSEKVPPNYQTRFMQEAFAIVYMLPLYEMDNKEFIRKALDLVAILARTGDKIDGQRANYLLNLIPFDKEDEESVAAFFKIAENFRSGGDFVKALEIYEQFFPLTDSPYYKEACLWSAFCRASSIPPQFGAANLSLDKFLKTYPKGDPPRDDQFYSLWRLVEAILHFNQFQQYNNQQKLQDISESDRFASRKLAEENLDIAMDRISESVVYSRVGYSWLPEVLALSAQCYARKERKDTASKVYQELKIFYPKHPKTRQFEIDFPSIAGN